MFSAFNYLETRFTSEEKRLSKAAEIWVHPRGNRRKHSKYLEKEKTGMSVTKQSKLCEKSLNSKNTILSWRISQLVTQHVFQAKTTVKRSPGHAVRVARTFLAIFALGLASLCYQH